MRNLDVITVIINLGALRKNAGNFMVNNRIGKKKKNLKATTEPSKQQRKSLMGNQSTQRCLESQRNS